MESVAKMNSDMAILHIPYGGIYLTASVIQACAFILERDAEFKQHFLDLIQNRGPLEGLIKSMPIYLVTVKDLAIRGSFEYARLNDLLS